MLSEILGLVLYAIMLMAILVLPGLLGIVADNLLYSLKNILWNWVDAFRSKRKK